MIVTENTFVDILLHFIILVVILSAIRVTIVLPVNTFLFTCLLYAILIVLVFKAVLPTLTLQNILKAIENCKGGAGGKCPDPKPVCPTPPAPAPKPTPPPPPPPPPSCPLPCPEHEQCDCPCGQSW